MQHQKCKHMSVGDYTSTYKTLLVYVCAFTYFQIAHFPRGISGRESVSIQFYYFVQTILPVESVYAIYLVFDYL
jgi:hypothetical protein